MEKEIKESKTIVATGILDLINQSKQAEKDGYVLEGNPQTMPNHTFTQIAIKYKK